MIEYIVGPVLAVLISMKFTAYTKTETIKELQSRVENLEKEIETNVAKKLVVTLTPLAKEVRNVKEAIGV